MATFKRYARRLVILAVMAVIALATVRGYPNPWWPLNGTDPAPHVIIVQTQ